MAMHVCTEPLLLEMSHVVCAALVIQHDCLGVLAQTQNEAPFVFLQNDPGYHVLAIYDEVLGFGLEPRQPLSQFPADIIIEARHSPCRMVLVLGLIPGAFPWNVPLPAGRESCLR